MGILGNLLSGITVTGTRAVAPTLGAVARAVAPAVAGGAAASLARPSVNTPAPANSNTLSGVTVNGTPAASSLDQALAPAAAPLLSNVISGAFGQDFSGGGGGNDDMGGGGTEVSPLTVTAPSLANGGWVPPAKELVPSIASGLSPSVLMPATMKNAELEPGLQDPHSDPNYKDAAELAAGGGLLGLLNLDPKTLLGAGILGAGLLANGGGGGSGGGGDPGGSLKTIADNNTGLANRLGQSVAAGQAGQIGGAGMNTIARNVRRAQAAIRQRYAQMGMSGSTAEQEDINSAADMGTELQFKIGQQMAQSGLQAITALTGQSAQIYTQLLNAQTQKDTQLGNALANFAAAVVK